MRILREFAMRALGLAIEIAGNIIALAQPEQQAVQALQFAGRDKSERKGNH